MSNDWSFIERRSGESIESLVATLLVLEYPEAGVAADAVILLFNMLRRIQS